MSIRNFLVRRHLLAPVVWVLTLSSGGCDQKPATATLGSSELWREFSGTNALQHVQHLVDFGPRPPGSEAIQKSRDYIISQLEQFGWKVTRQSFSGDTPQGKVEFVNLIARFGSSQKAEKGGMFLVSSHYDTKTFDSIRFVGANDGGSSTGVLLEVARVLSRNPKLAEKIELVFFDGEEAYEEFSETDGLYGSRHYAEQLVSENRATRFRGGILLDMVGDKSLTVTLPPDSPTTLAADIFAASDALKVRNHFTYFDRDVTDDHTPLNAANVPTIDLIDFDFPWWHTADDTMDKISAESLGIVGAVTVYYLSNFAFK